MIVLRRIIKVCFGMARWFSMSTVFTVFNCVLTAFPFPDEGICLRGSTGELPTTSVHCSEADS